MLSLKISRLRVLSGVGLACLFFFFMTLCVVGSGWNIHVIAINGYMPQSPGWNIEPLVTVQRDHPMCEWVLLDMLKDSRQREADGVYTPPASDDSATVASCSSTEAQDMWMGDIYPASFCGTRVKLSIGDILIFTGLGGLCAMVACVVLATIIVVLPTLFFWVRLKTLSRGAPS